MSTVVTKLPKPHGLTFAQLRMARLKKSQEEESLPCQRETLQVITCLKANNFEDSKCNEFEKALNECTNAHLKFGKVKSKPNRQYRPFLKVLF
jgi:hypothetical protein